MHMFPGELHTFHHVSKTVLHFALCDSSIEMAHEFYTYSVENINRKHGKATENAGCSA